MEERIENIKQRLNLKTVYSLIVKGENDQQHVAFFKKPTRPVLSSYMALVNRDPMKAREIIFSNCWIEGDEVIKTDEDLYVSALLQIDDLIEIRSAEVKKH